MRRRRRTPLLADSRCGPGASPNLTARRPQRPERGAADPGRDIPALRPAVAEDLQLHDVAALVNRARTIKLHARDPLGARQVDMGRSHLSLHFTVGARRVTAPY